MTGRQPEYQNLKRYKKQKDVTAQNVLTVFTTTFLIMLVFFIGAARHMTPSVDVSIGENSTTDAKETGLGVKGFIDNRLKAIQSEDSSDVAKRLEEKVKSNFDEDDEDEYFSKDLEEKVKIPVRTVKQEVLTQKKLTETEDKVTVKVVKPTTIPQPKPKADVTPIQTTAPATTIKVVVGSYNSLDQAKIAQTILQESSVGVTPFIKNINGAYTLQVGSFSSEEKAQSLANELLRHNFPARIIRN